MTFYILNVIIHNRTPKFYEICRTKKHLILRGLSWDNLLLFLICRQKRNSVDNRQGILFEKLYIGIIVCKNTIYQIMEKK